MYRYFRLLVGALLVSATVSAQVPGFNFTCRKDTVLPAGCTTGCGVTLKAVIPDLYAQSNSYSVNKISQTQGCFNPPIPPNNTEANPTELATDDAFGPVVNLGFNFVYFGTTYTQFTASTNGAVSFDITEANTGSVWPITNAGVPVDLPSAQYERAMIMGPFHDINLAPTTSPQRRVQYQVLGTAPYRRWVLSFYKIPLYSCSNLIENTHQIVLYESTGIIEVHVYSKQICLGWNQGRAMIGMQDYDRINAVMAPGRRASDPPWGSINMNESWRFIPNSGTTLFKRVELINPATGAIITTGTAVSRGDGTMDATFTNVCVPAGVTNYVVRPWYRKMDAPIFLNQEVAGHDTIRVTRPLAPLTVTATATESGCTPSGTVTVTAPIGTGAYNYQLDGGTAQLTNVFTNVAAGSHTVTVTSVGGACTGTASVTVPAATPLQATAAANNSTCPTATNGSVTITPSNGLAPLEFRMGTGSWQQGATFNGLAAGSYFFFFRDASGCVSDTIHATVAAGPALQATSASTATTCPTALNGTATLNASNGTAPLQFRIGSGAWQSSNTFTGLAAGTYQLSFTDAAGCISDPVPVTVAAGPALVGTTTGSTTTCFGANNGTATMNAGNGTAPLEYSINNGPWQTSNTFTGLAAGSYQLTFRDAAGCTSQSMPVTVNPGNTLQGSAAATATSCSGATNGSVTVTPNNPGATLEYSSNSGGPWQASASFTGLAAGNYQFYIRDAAAGCMSNAIPATVTNGQALTATSSKTDVSCNGGNNGSATLVPSATGQAPFSFSSDNFTTSQSGATFTGLAAGSHTLYFKDAAGCSGSLAVTINQPAPIAAPAPVIQQVKCNGGTDGSIAVAPTGGTQPYEYRINNGAYGPSATFAVPAGTHTIDIRDANGCTMQLSGVIVSEPVALTGSVSDIIDASCNGGADGSFKLNGAGGKAPYRYSITGTGYVSTPTFNVNPGSYNGYVQDDNNCTHNLPGTIIVGMQNDLSYAPMSDQTLCEGGTVTLQPVTNATAFTWQGVNVRPNNAAQSSVTVEPTQDTVYTLTATLGRCAINDTVNVFVNEAPVADAGASTEICYGKSDTLAASGGVSYEWSPATYLTGNLTGPSPIVSRPEKDITYTLYVRDAANCRSLTPATVTVRVTPPIQILVSPADTIGYIGDKIQLKAVSPGTHYSWTPATNLDNPNIANPVITVAQDMIYTVRSWTDAGCAGEKQFFFKAYKGPEIYVPDAFTPNGDGLNDLLRPFSVGIERLHYFRVYSRWGDVVYEYKGERRGPVVYNMLSSNIGWDGTVSGRPVATGTFVWVAEGVTKTGKVVSRKGVVTLIR